MCKVSYPSRFVRSQTSVIEAIPEIDCDCPNPGDSDLRSLRKYGGNRRGCEYCIREIKRSCDGINCCWDPEYNGWGWEG